MLKRLDIENYLLIEHQRIEFQAGLSVITGPTGSGKSMLTGAIAAVFGGRLHADVACKADEPVKISAFLCLSTAERAMLPAYDSGDGTLKLERIIKPNGKSVYRCQDKIIKLADVMNIKAVCYSHCRQHQQLDLFDDTKHLDMLDQYAQIETHEVTDAYQAWQSAQRKLDLLLAARAEHDVETIQFFYEELEAFFEHGYEYEQLLQEMAAYEKLLKSFEALEKLSQHLNQHGADQLIEAIIADPLQQVFASTLMDYQAQHAAFKQALSIQLNEQPASDDYRVLKDMQMKWHELARKHRCQPYELMQKKMDYAQVLQTINTLDEDQAQAVVEEAKLMYVQLAVSISAKRREAAQTLAQQMSKDMQKLGMQQGLFFVDVQAASQGPTGQDACQFLASTNLGQMPQPLKNTLSGGELSRVNLAFQEQCASQMRPIQLLDEVDVGISGQVAEQVATLLYQRAQRHQVIVISHLPQMTMMADHHGYVSKQGLADKTQIDFCWLTGMARINGLAELIAGESINALAKEHAAELLKDAEAIKARVRTSVLHASL